MKAEIIPECPRKAVPPENAILVVIYLIPSDPPILRFSEQLSEWLQLFQESAASFRSSNEEL